MNLFTSMPNLYTGLPLDHTPSRGLYSPRQEGRRDAVSPEAFSVTREQGRRGEGESWNVGSVCQPWGRRGGKFESQAELEGHGGAGAGGQKHIGGPHMREGVMPAEVLPALRGRQEGGLETPQNPSLLA